jgi:MFS family permease
MKRILTKRTLIIIGAAESISGIGDWITMMAVLAMLVFRGGGGVMASSGVFMAGLLPTLVVSPVAGWLVDRFNRKTLLIGSQLLAGLVVSGLFFTTQIELIYVILALEAVVLSVITPTRQAVIPDLVSRDDYARANAFLQQLAGLVKVFAPVIAGMVLSVMDPHTAILFDVASFLLAAGILTFLPSLPVHSETREPGNKNQTVSLKTVWQKLPQLQLLFSGVFIAILAIVGFDVLSSVYVRDVLHQGEKIYGFAISLVGIGSLCATMVLMLRKTAKNPWIDIIMGFSLLTVIPLALVIAFQFEDASVALYMLMMACFIGGIGNGLVHVQIGTIMQLVTPGAILGQVGGWLQSVMVAGQLVGLILTPVFVPGLVTMQAYFAGMLVLMGMLILFLAFNIMKKGGLKPDQAAAEW